VTRWSKLGTSFAGVSVDTLLDAARPRPEASHVVAFCYGGYTTNLPLDDLRDGKAWVVWEHEGQPLPAEHGGPARLLVPTCTCGRAPSGWPACACSTTTPRASGNRSATTIWAILGGSNDTGATELQKKHIPVSDEVYSVDRTGVRPLMRSHGAWLQHQGLSSVEELSFGVPSSTAMERRVHQPSGI